MRDWRRIWRTLTGHLPDSSIKEPRFIPDHRAAPDLAAALGAAHDATERGAADEATSYLELVRGTQSDCGPSRSALLCNMGSLEWRMITAMRLAGSRAFMTGAGPWQRS